MANNQIQHKLLSCEQTFTLASTVPAAISAISEYIEYLENWMKLLLTYDKVIFQICLSLDELLTNIVKHGFRGEPGHQINIVVEKHINFFQIKICDQAPEFNPLLVLDSNTNASLEEREIGGLGIHLIKNSVDQFEYERIDNQNKVTLKKNIHQKT